MQVVCNTKTERYLDLLFLPIELIIKVYHKKRKDSTSGTQYVRIWFVLFWAFWKAINLQSTDLVERRQCCVQLLLCINRACKKYLVLLLNADQFCEVLLPGLKEQSESSLLSPAKQHFHISALHESKQIAMLCWSKANGQVYKREICLW